MLFAGLLVALFVSDVLDRVISISGIIIGMSNAMFLPALCHYILVAETKCAKIIDIAIMCAAVFMFIFGPITIACQWCKTDI